MLKLIAARTPSRASASHWIDGAILALAASMFVFGTAMIILRAAVLSTPVYSSDEFGHWANSRYLAAHLAPALFDPFLPQLNNHLYFLATGWIARAPEGATAMRTLNYVFIALSAVSIYSLARTFVAMPLAVLAAAFVFAFGFTAYGVAVMPEMLFMFIMTGLALVMTRAWSPRRPIASFGVGVIVGALMMVKPHGIAVLLSSAATMIVVPVVLGRRLRAAMGAAPDLLALVVGTSISIMLIASLARGALVLSPAAFIGEFYSGVASSSTPFLATLVDIVRYFAGHCVVLLLFFSPTVVLGASIVPWLLGNGVGERDAAKLRSLLVLTVFTLLSALSVFTMVSIFSHSAGGGLAFEANRIHGRYWGALIPLFVTMTMAVFSISSRNQNLPSKAGRWAERAAGLIWLTVILIFALITSSSFAIYPWDFPELFAFYRPINPNWPYTAWLPWSFVLATVLLTACAVAYFLLLPGRRLGYVASLAAVFVIGNVNTTGWQISIMPDLRPFVDAGQAVTRIVGRQSEGLFVAPDYWGRRPYVAFQLPITTHVAVKPENATLSEADLPPSATWVLTMGPYAVQFPYSKAIPLATLTLYLRGTQP